MNFFGHAAVAAQVTPAHGAAAFVLGAMLPDLCAMAGGRVPEARASGPLAAGIAHHHRVDAVFHDSAIFLSLSRQAVAMLREAGVPRGPARAAAHVGLELLLDGRLARRAAARRSFQAALACEQASELEVGFDSATASRWRALRHHLQEGPIPLAYADPRFVSERIRAALRHRPRLAIGPVEQEAMGLVLHRMAGMIESQGDELLAQVTQHLFAQTGDMALPCCP